MRAASWFAALGEPLTEGDRVEAKIYSGADEVALMTSWPEAEQFLKSADASLDWWNSEEAERKALAELAENRELDALRPAA